MRESQTEDYFVTFANKVQRPYSDKVDLNLLWDNKCATNMIDITIFGKYFSPDLFKKEYKSYSK